MTIPQTTYPAEAEIGIEGQLIEIAPRKIRTYVNAVTCVAQVDEFEFVLTWAAADSVLTTINGITTTTVLAGGEDTIEEAVDAVLSDLNLSTFLLAIVTLLKVDTDTIRVTSRVAGVPLTATMVATTAGDGDINKTTPTANATGQDLPFGRAVQQASTGARHMQLPAGAGIFIGITAFSHAHDNRSLAGSDGIPNKEPGNVMTLGVILATSEDEVLVADMPNVFYRITQGAAAGETVGRFRTDADGGDAVQIENARWVGIGDAEALIKLELFAPTSG